MQASVVHHLIAGRHLRSEIGLAQGAGVREEMPLEPEFGRERRRGGKFERAAREAIAAKGILIGIGKIAGANAGILEAAQRIAADIKALVDQGWPVEAPYFAGF